MELEEISADAVKWEIIKRGVDFYKENREVLMYGTYEEYLESQDSRKIIEFRGNKIECPGVIGSVYSYQGKTYMFAYNYTEACQEICVRGQKIAVKAKGFEAGILR
jgi:hypothetical protein